MSAGQEKWQEESEADKAQHCEQTFRHFRGAVSVHRRSEVGELVILAIIRDVYTAIPGEATKDGSPQDPRYKSFEQIIRTLKEYGVDEAVLCATVRTVFAEGLSAEKPLSTPEEMDVFWNKRTSTSPQAPMPPAQEQRPQQVQKQVSQDVKTTVAPEKKTPSQKEVLTKFFKRRG